MRQAHTLKDHGALPVMHTMTMGQMEGEGGTGRERNIVYHNTTSYLSTFNPPKSRDFTPFAVWASFTAFCLSSHSGHQGAEW